MEGYSSTPISDISTYKFYRSDELEITYDSDKYEIIVTDANGTKCTPNRKGYYNFPDSNITITINKVDLSTLATINFDSSFTNNINSYLTVYASDSDTDGTLVNRRFSSTTKWKINEAKIKGSIYNSNNSSYYFTISNVTWANNNNKTTYVSQIITSSSTGYDLPDLTIICNVEVKAYEVGQTAQFINNDGLDIAIA